MLPQHFWRWTTASYIEAQKCKGHRAPGNCQVVRKCDPTQGGYRMKMTGQVLSFTAQEALSLLSVLTERYTSSVSLYPFPAYLEHSPDICLMRLAGTFWRVCLFVIDMEEHTHRPCMKSPCFIHEGFFYLVECSCPTLIDRKQLLFCSSPFFSCTRT